MNFFQVKNGQLVELSEQPFRLERDLQHLFEENLELLTGLKFVASEFSIQNQRLDTLAYDEGTKSFVVIEYKRSSNASVLDQGVSYLNTLLKYKADFILEYQESTGEHLTRQEIDWSQTRVVFVAPHFTRFQKQAVDFKDLNIELWEVIRLEDDILAVNGIQKSANAPSIKSSSLSKNDDASLISKELKTYSEEDHLINKSDDMIELYEAFKEAIYQLIPNIKVVPQKMYIAFKHDKKNIIDIEIQQKQLKLWLNAKMGAIDDPKHLYRDVSNTGKYGNGDYEIKVKDSTHIEYIMSLVKQIL